MSIIINLNKIEDLKDFVNDIRDLPWDIDCFRDHYIVDAKSLLGLMSLSLAEPVTVRINTEDEEAIKQFEEICLKYKA